MAHDVMPGRAADNRQSLYERDYYSWALEQARALKARHLKALDWENLAEEVEDLARRERRELESRLEVLLEHLLKWQFQPRRRSRSWTATIAMQRFKIRRRLEQNPGLKPTIPAVLADAYASARIDFTNRELGSGKSKLPDSCPWTFEQIMNEQFRPSNSHTSGL
jgi:hypothetical protein